jgi:hypothetical protein
VSIREATRQPSMFEGRVVAWFSCGGASAVMSKLASIKYKNHPAFEVVYCDTSKSEHPDNGRFLHDVEQWIGREIKLIRHKKWSTVDEVFAAMRYMSGPYGASCTKQLKRLVRIAYQGPGDLHLFGFTSEETDRIIDLEEAEPDLRFEWILRDAGLAKGACFRLLSEAGIRLPKMYELGFQNNNCIGCVKAQSAGYWNRIRRHFPDVFDRRVRQSRELGVRLVKINGKRAFLDELLPTTEPDGGEERVTCGPLCGVEPAPRAEHKESD